MRQWGVAVRKNGQPPISLGRDLAECVKLTAMGGGDFYSFGEAEEYCQKTRDFLGDDGEAYVVAYDDDTWEILEIL